jgi:hypothetical protein
MNKMQIFAKALLEQIEVARVRQLSGLQESFNTKHADTARAISIFQKYAGLDQTGSPDPKTMQLIKMVAENALGEEKVWDRIQRKMTTPTPAEPDSTFRNQTGWGGYKDGPNPEADTSGQPATSNSLTRSDPKDNPEADKSWTPPAAAPAAPPAGSVQAASQPTPGVNNGGAQANDDAGGMSPAPAAQPGKMDWAGSEKGTPLTPDASANAAAAGKAAAQPGKMDWAGSEKGTPLTPDASANAAAAGQAAAAPTIVPRIPPPYTPPAAGDAAKNPVGTTNAATAIPTGGLENPANNAPPTAAPPAGGSANRDSMPFGKAFADAKAKGEKQFMWKGKPYAVAMKSASPATAQTAPQTKTGTGASGFPMTASPTPTPNTNVSPRADYEGDVNPSSGGGTTRPQPSPKPVASAVREDAELTAMLRIAGLR